MAKHYRISLLAAALAQEAAMAHAYEHSGNAIMEKIAAENILDEINKIAFELGYSFEKTTAPALRAAA